MTRSAPTVGKRARILFILSIALVTLIAALLLAAAVRAALTSASLSAFSGNVILIESYRLSGDQTGDLVVAAVTIALDADARVAGNASLVAENARVSGQIDGDLTILAQQVTLDGLRVAGNLHVLADSVSIAGAQIDGESLIDADTLTIDRAVSFASPPALCATVSADDRSDRLVAPCPPSSRDPFGEVIALREWAQRSAPIETIFITILLTAIVAALSALSAALAPMHLGRVTRGMRRHTLQSGLLGIGLYALAIGLTSAQVALLGIIPIVGSLVSVFYLLALLCLLFLIGVGLCALALAIGTRLLGESALPMAAAAIGGVMVAVILSVIALLPFGDSVAALLFALLTAVGTGAAFGTRLGAPARRAQSADSPRPAEA